MLGSRSDTNNGGRIGHHEVELADVFVQVFVVAVPQADITGQGMLG
jgi:hypothetical protein